MSLEIILVIAFLFTSIVYYVPFTIWTLLNLVKQHRYLKTPHVGGLLVHAEGSIQGGYQVREFRLPLPYHEAFSACFEATRHIKRAKMKRVDRAHGEIEFMIPMTWVTFGSRVGMRVVAFDESSSYVRIESRGRITKSALDCGTNFDIMEILLRALARRTQTFTDSHQLTHDAPASQRLLTS